MFIILVVVHIVVVTTTSDVVLELVVLGVDLVLVELSVMLTVVVKLAVVVELNGKFGCVGWLIFLSLDCCFFG